MSLMSCAIVNRNIPYTYIFSWVKYFAGSLKNMDFAVCKQSKSQDYSSGSPERQLAVGSPRQVGWQSGNGHMKPTQCYHHSELEKK